LSPPATRTAKVGYAHRVSTQLAEEANCGCAPCEPSQRAMLMMGHARSH